MAAALANLDPTGTLSAVSAGISLVSAGLRLGTAAKRAHDARAGGGGGRSVSVSVPGPSTLHRSNTTPNEVPVALRDPEHDRRAYETVNFVLREFGSRICAAGMVDEHALTKALTAATQHIEVNLFSGEANRLFESLAPKLADPILVNSVFTSIYFIGALNAELASSLPNYKDKYQPLGPRLVQQLFRAAIGEDAFRDNLSANLDAYKTLTWTAGLLRPTDIGYSSFPKFPSFAPCRYSSTSFTDVNHNKRIYEKLVKHFEKAGFPQPTPVRQAEVGLIRDWKFLSGDTNSRAFDVDRADRNIGENFGKVLHWLICSAERLPPGQAVIAYYDQHIELIKWIQHRMGYAVLYPNIDLNLGGPHALLDRRLRNTIDSWVILMPSEAAKAAKRANADHWMQTHMQSAARAPPNVGADGQGARPISMAIPTTSHVPPLSAQVPPPAVHLPPPAAQVPPPAAQVPPPAAQVPPSASQVPPLAAQVPPPMAHAAPMVAQVPTTMVQMPPSARQLSEASSHALPMASVPLPANRVSMAMPASPPLSEGSSPPGSPAMAEMPTLRDIQPTPKTAEQQVEEIFQHFKAALVPQFQRLWYQPSPDSGVRDSQCNVLAHTIERETIDRLDRIHISENHPARMRRKGLIDQAQELMDFLPVYKELGPEATQGRPLPGALQSHMQAMVSSTVTKPPAPQAPLSTGSSPPPYSPVSPPSAASSAAASAFPFPEKPKPTAIRRKAPPPPKKFISAKALYDFEPPSDNEEELGFKEDDEIEIIEKNAAMEEDGWCRARVKGSKRIGLVPLEYLEIVATVTRPIHAPSKPSTDHAPPPGLLGELPIADRSMPPKLFPTHQQSGPSTPQTAIHNISHTHIAVNTPQQAPSNQAHQVSPQSNQPISTNNGIGKFDVAGLAAATIGAAAGVGAIMHGGKGLGQGHKPAHPALFANQHQHKPWHDSESHGQSNIGAQNNLDGNVQNNTGEQNIMPGLDGGGNTGLVEESPPMVDLSAFGEAPFESQTSSAISNVPIAIGSDEYYVPQETFEEQPSEADLTTTSANAYAGTTSTTDVVQDVNSTTSAVDPAPSTSPFASLATTSIDSSTYTDTTVGNGCGTTSTYESFTEDQTISVDNQSTGSVVDTTEETSWSTDVIDDDDGGGFDY